VTVLAVGVAVLDVVLSVDELPAGGEKYRATDARVVGGGCAANAAAAVASLGGRALLATRLGDDQIGEMIVAGLRDDGVDCTLARRFAGNRSSFSSVLVNSTGERQIVNFRDAGLPGDNRWLNESMPDFDVGLADTRWPEGALAVMRAAAERGLPGVLDAEAPVMEANDAVLAASHTVFSAAGLRDFTQCAKLDDGLDQAARRCPGFVAVTDGSQGVMWHARERVEHEPAFRIDAVDTLGAGDVWHGAFALALGERMTIRDAVRFASATAALKCMRASGRSGTPKRAEVEELLHDQVTRS
jgi:sulfofructose kinase